MKPILTIFFLAIQTLIVQAQVQPAEVDINNNGNKLYAKFWQADTGILSPTVILLHGFPGNMSSPLGLAERLNKAGLNVLFFNYEGSYLSEGTFSFDHCIENAGAAINFLLDPGNQARYPIDTTRIVLCGYSMGGTIALESGMYNDKVTHIISIANDDHSISIKKAAADPEFRERFQEFIGRSFEPSGPFRGDLKTQMEYYIQNVDRYDLVKNAEKLSGKKVLFIVGWEDKASLVEVYVLPLYRKLQQFNAGDVSIQGFETDHQFGNVLNEVSETIIHWIQATGPGN